MSRNYWLDLFTGTTWEEFKKHGANVSGFRRRRRRLAKKIRPGDYLICYLTGIMRLVGILEVKSECYEDDTPIWDDGVFPIRFKVELIYELTPKTAVPILSLKDKLSLFQNLTSPHAWSGFFRASPGKFDPHDGEIITQAIKAAIANPVARDYDEAKYRRRPKIFESTKIGVVTVPEEDKEETKLEITPKYEIGKSTHDEMQWLLLKLGSDLGLDVWVARNDKNRTFNGIPFSDIRNLKTQLPRQFDDATNRTIELIDVLWLQGDAILAAFEVEHTTAIYSGLLRMADLVTMQPNIKINLYLVAPEERREKVVLEINRPTFAKLKPPLPKICKFLPYSGLKKEIENIGSRVKYIKPEFIEEIAESCEPDEA
ncbi:MAG TPA: EVE domain-containing protein [Phycisphaerales bacterium]|nr:EVE domain-containing protein [Phycisphaerales bacterium]